MDITWVFSKQGQEESSQENIEVLEYSNYVQVCDSNAQQYFKEGRAGLVLFHYHTPGNDGQRGERSGAVGTGWPWAGAPCMARGRASSIFILFL